MSEDTIDKILDTISNLWTCSPKVEISLEANPTSVEAKKFKSFRESGINRLSMGIQALNDNDLKRLGRLHTAKEAEAAFKIAAQHFDRVSFDLMYGRQNQTVKDWEKELLTAIAMSIGHLSLYQLTIEDNTRFGDLFANGKLLGLPKDDTSVEFYNLTQNICDANGLPSYEISNHAKKEKMHLFHYESISNSEQAEEYIIMGLRLREGVNLSYYNQLAKTKIPEEIINELVNGNLIRLDNQILTTTKAGKVLTNYVIKKLLC